jgi:hypothetical protein
LELFQGLEEEQLPPVGPEPGEVVVGVVVTGGGESPETGQESDLAVVIQELSALGYCIEVSIRRPMRKQLLACQIITPPVQPLPLAVWRHVARVAGSM